MPLYSFAVGPPLLLPAMRAGRGGGSGGSGSGTAAMEGVGTSGTGADSAFGNRGGGAGTGMAIPGVGGSGGTAALAAQVRNVGIPDPPLQKYSDLRLSAAGLAPPGLID